MNEELLAAARDCLNLRLISLRESQLKLDAEFDPTIQAELALQTRIGLKSFEWVEKIAPDSTPTKGVRGLVDAGVRLVFPQSSAEDVSPKVAAEFTAVFLAEYECVPDKVVSDDGAKEFLQHNAVYHVWSYWREYVQSTFNRAALPVITLPMMVIKPSVRPAAEAIQQPASEASAQ
jgi:hypothetical protein